MGITASQQRVFDKKQSTEKNMKEAAMKQNENIKSGKAKKTPDEELLAKTKRRLKELFYGDKTYLPKEKKSKKTTRTKAVESGLKQAGLSESDIAKFKKK